MRRDIISSTSCTYPLTYSCGQPQRYTFFLFRFYFGLDSFAPLLFRFYFFVLLAPLLRLRFYFFHIPLEVVLLNQQQR